MLNKKKATIPYQNAKNFSDVLRGQQSNFFAAFRKLSLEKRHALKIIYGFARLADDCVDEIQDPLQQKQALDFWQKQVENLSSGHVNHPLMHELQDVAQRYAIPIEYFLLLIQGCRFDIDKKSYQNFSELSDYCYHVAGVVGLMCLKIFEYQSPNSQQMAIDLGLAFQLTNILRDVASDAKLGRIYLPAQELKDFGYTEKNLKNGVLNDEWHAFATFFVSRAKTYYQKARLEIVKDKKNKLAPVKVMFAYYYRLLEKICEKDYAVFHCRVRLNFWDKLRLLCCHKKS